MKFVDIKNDIAFRKISDKRLWTKDELDAYDYAAMRHQDDRGKTELSFIRAIEKTKLEFVKKMIKANRPIEEIIEFTGLSRKSIVGLINDLKDN